jgi:radical S-adenosyl methionine domain-containing protein 2
MPCHLTSRADLDVISYVNFKVVGNVMNTNTKNIIDLDELVINMHITEACNYSCDYCYAKWDRVNDTREVIHTRTQLTKLILEVVKFFNPLNVNNPDHPLSSYLNWKSLRVNFAGGEPTLYKEQLIRYINLAKIMECNISLITNASNLADQIFMKEVATKLTMLGVSLDSASYLSNKSIGRMDRSGNILNQDNLVKILDEIRVVNPSIIIKINTVVNRFNFNEDMTSFIERIKPNKWKVLRMLPVNNNNLSITDEQFNRFIEVNKRLHNVMSVENNDDMISSYIMIDPLGRFFQNQPNKSGDHGGYIYSSSILDSGIAEAFKEVPFCIDKFSHRYLR